MRPTQKFPYNIIVIVFLAVTYAGCSNDRPGTETSSTALQHQTNTADFYATGSSNQYIAQSSAKPSNVMLTAQRSESDLPQILLEETAFSHATNSDDYYLAGGQHASGPITSKNQLSEKGLRTNSDDHYISDN